MQRAFRSKVVIVSPSLLMLAIQVIQQIHRDARMREAADKIHAEVGHLMDDLRRLRERVLKLGQHFDQANEDVRQILISAEKVEKRGARIRDVEFEGDSEDKRRRGDPGADCAAPARGRRVTSASERGVKRRAGFGDALVGLFQAAGADRPVARILLRAASGVVRLHAARCGCARPASISAPSACSRWSARPTRIKFLWAPLVDALDVPVLSRLLGRRRGWLVFAQFC